MQLNVYDGYPLKRVGVMEGFSFARLTTRYQSPGEMELRAPINSAIRFTPGMTIWRSDMAEAFLVELVELRTSSYGVEQVILGRTHSALLDQRVLPLSSYFEGTAGKVSAMLIDSVLSSPNRDLPGLSAAINDSLGKIIRCQPQMTTLLRTIIDICVDSGLGFRTVFNPDGGAFVFEIYEGKNRAADTASPWTVFSPDLDTLVHTRSAKSTRRFANVAYVIGAVDNATHLPKLEEVNLNNAVGLDRFETLVTFDRNASLESGSNLTPAQYSQSMRDFGVAMIERMAHKETFEGEIRSDTSMYRLNHDYRVGDLVKVRVKDWGVETSARVAAVEDIQENFHKLRKVHLKQD